eukprot:SM000119S25643  [mRNA]  locus=s119:179698:183463:- [translate_table: standard]
MAAAAAADGAAEPRGIGELAGPSGDGHSAAPAGPDLNIAADSAAEAAGPADDDEGTHGSAAGGSGNDAGNGSGTDGAPGRTAWLPGKRHPDETVTLDRHLSRMTAGRHGDNTRSTFLCLAMLASPSTPGPVHLVCLIGGGARYGDEHKLAGFAAILQAIISFVQNMGDTIKVVTAGALQIVFVTKGPVYLVSISSTDEPVIALQAQLELLHAQVMMILTSAVDRCFLKNPNFDMRPLLGGTENSFSSLIHDFSWNYAAMLHSFTCLPLSFPHRQAVAMALQEASSVHTQYGLLLAKNQVVSLLAPKKSRMHPDDILLIANFVSSSDAFRSSETFTPVCLPKLNPSIFMYAYVRYLSSSTVLVLLSTDADAFHQLKECRLKIEQTLQDLGVLKEISASVARGGLRVEDLPMERRDQAGASASSIDWSIYGGSDWSYARSPQAYAGPYMGPYMLRSRSSGMYGKERGDAGGTSRPEELADGPESIEKVNGEQGDRKLGAGPSGLYHFLYRILFAWRTDDFELYAAFDSLSDKVLFDLDRHDSQARVRTVTTSSLYIGDAFVMWLLQSQFVTRFASGFMIWIVSSFSMDLRHRPGDM